jgi:hypothetical protein
MPLVVMVVVVVPSLSPEQFEKWANALAEEATAASLAQPAAGLLRALTDVAPADARATLEDLAAQLDTEASAASEQAAESEAPTEQTEAASAEKKEESQA